MYKNLKNTHTGASWPNDNRSSHFILNNPELAFIY